MLENKKDKRYFFVNDIIICSWSCVMVNVWINLKKPTYYIVEYCYVDFSAYATCSEAEVYLTSYTNT